MDTSDTPENKESRAAKLEAEALALRAQAQEAREQQKPVGTNAKTTNINLQSTIPEEDPEYRAILKIKTEMQQSLASMPPNQEDQSQQN